MRSSLLKTVAAAVVLLAATSVWADNPGHHPAYLHALSDLRDARAHLQHYPNEPASIEQDHAIEHIDQAINDIKKAAIMDGKNIDDHVPVDAHLARRDRFRKAMELLDRAKRDVSGEEDQPDTQGLQIRVIGHIDSAHHSVQHAIDILVGG